MATVQMTTHGIFTPNGLLATRLKQLQAAADKAATKAAREANSVSKTKAKAIRPPAPPRPGRVQTPGALARAINWQVIGGDVVLDRKRLDNVVPWWVVQEIGTGQKASAKYGQNPELGNRSRGRPKKSEINNPGGRHFSVRSQRGRRIPGSLAFGTGPGGKFEFPSGRRNQQLYLLSSLKGVPFSPLKNKATAVNAMYIKREIEGKHFIRDGAREGYRDYRNDVVAAARATLVRRK